MLHTAAYMITVALLLTGWWLFAGAEGRPSPIAKVLGTPDTRVHVWLGWGLAVVLALPLVVWWRGVIAFARETFRSDRGDGRWWLRWPTGIFTGRFGRHEGHFDPGQRVANVVMVSGLLVLAATGIGMITLHGGPLFALLSRIHRWSTFVITPVLAGHVLVAVGVLPGYRGVWRAMHFGGRVSEETARRLWPAWAESSEGTSKPRNPSPIVVGAGKTKFSSRLRSGSQPSNPPTQDSCSSEEREVPAQRSDWRRIMAKRSTGYGRKWKKWLAIYAVAGAVVYVIVYLVFFYDSGGGLY